MDAASRLPWECGWFSRFHEVRICGVEDIGYRHGLHDGTKKWYRRIRIRLYLAMNSTNFEDEKCDSWQLGRNRRLVALQSFGS